VPPAIEAHERFKKEGAVLEGLYGTPQTAALNKKLEEDKILGTSPGFGTASAADGKRYPYTFPIAASYWSQAVRRWPSPRSSWGRPQGQEDRLHLLRQSGGQGAAGRSSRTSPRTRASSCAPSRCPRPARDGRADPRHHRPLQADFSHHPSVRAGAVGLHQGAEGQGLPLSKVSALVWASSEADIIAAGGMGVAEGYNTIQFAGVGKDFPVIKDIEAMYKARASSRPRRWTPRCSTTAAS
jgi:branched-chain amino acid transport system substrate-binding protein